MAELRFYSGIMATGKSALCLQMAFNYDDPLLLTINDRSGESAITSRIGLERGALSIDADDNILRLAKASKAEIVIIDEAQFLTPFQVNNLARVVDELDVSVYAYGLTVDFRGQLFPGSKRLFEIADRRLELQVEARCWCGKIAQQNARLVDGMMVLTGDTVAVGDVGGEAKITYELLCRKHFFERKVKA